MELQIPEMKHWYARFAAHRTCPFGRARVFQTETSISILWMLLCATWRLWWTALGLHHFALMGQTDRRSRPMKYAAVPSGASRRHSFCGAPIRAEASFSQRLTGDNVFA